MALQAILGGLQGLSALGGLLSSSAGKRRAEEARQQAINDLASQLDRDYQDRVANNQRSLLALTGTGGDAVQGLGQRLGSSLAGAGVYNSSATAGALAQSQRDIGANLARLAQEQSQQQLSHYNQNRQQVTNMRLNLANDNYAQSLQQQADARSGLAGFLGTLGQYNLSRSGATQTQSSLPRSHGGYGNNSVLTPPIVPVQPPSLNQPPRRKNLGFNLLNGYGEY